MGDKLKKYLSVLQSTSYSSEFRDLVAEQLLQFCDPMKSVQSAQNYLVMIDILTSPPTEGQFKKQHLSVLKGLFKYCHRPGQPVDPAFLSTVLQALLEDKKSELAEYVQTAAKSSAKASEGKSRFAFCNVTLTAEVDDTTLKMISDETEIDPKSLIENCAPLLGDTLAKEDSAAPKKESAKKGRKKKAGTKSKAKTKSKSKSAGEKESVETYLSRHENPMAMLSLQRTVQLGFKSKHKKGEKGSDSETLTGHLLMGDIWFGVCQKLVRQLTHENWHARQIAATILRELFDIARYEDFAMWYLCDLEVNTAPENEGTISVKDVRPIRYDSKAILAIYRDLVSRLLAGIVCDYFTDYLDNTIATPVREAFGNLLKKVMETRGGEALVSPGIVQNVSEVIMSSTYEWMSRYNATLILKYLLPQWKANNVLSTCFNSIKEPLLSALNSEDEIRVMACRLLKKCRTLVCGDEGYYLQVVRAIFENIKKTDDIECSAIFMLRLLESLFMENRELIKSAVQHIDLKLICVFAYHKLVEVRHKAFSLIFKLIRQLFDTLSRKTIEKHNPELVQDLQSLLLVSIQAGAMESSGELLKEVHRGLDQLLPLLTADEIYGWFSAKKDFLLELLSAAKVADFSQFVFFHTEQYATASSYYTFLSEPVTPNEIFTAFHLKAYNLTRLYAALAAASPKVGKELLPLFAQRAQSPILLSEPTPTAFFLIYWLARRGYGGAKELAMGVLNGAASFSGQLSQFMGSDDISRYMSIMGEFCAFMPEMQEVAALAAADIQSDSVGSLDRVYGELQKTFQQQKDKGDTDTRIHATANLLMEVSKINDWVTSESNKLRALASASVIAAAALEKKLPEKLNPVIKPLLVIMEKDHTSKVYHVVSKALAQLQHTNQGNSAVNEKITSLLTAGYLALQDIPQTCYLADYVKQYMKLHKEEAFSAHNGALMKYSMQTLEKCEKLPTEVTGKKLVLEFMFLSSILRFVKADQHLPFVQSLLDALLQFIYELEAKGKSKLATSYHRVKASIDREGVADQVEEKLKSIVLECVKILGKGSYEGLTLSFIKIISERNFTGCRILSFFVTEIPKEYMPYLPYYILPIIRNFSSDSSQLSTLSYQLFSNILKILPITNSELFSNVPKLASKSAESERIEAEGIEGVKFLRSFLVTEQKYDYKLTVTIKEKLRSYQMEGVAWMAFMHRYNINCALCDDMGLGKTIEALVLIANEIKMYPGGKAPPSLVVCPTTLMKNWLYEIPKFFDDSILRGRIYSGPGREGKKSTKMFDSDNIIITSYERVRSEIEMLKKQEFFYIVLDEAHVVKNSKAKLTLAVKQLRGQRKLILSGTPLHNNVTEIWSLFDFLNPGFLGTEAQFEQTYTRHLMANLKKINEKIEETSDFGSALESLKQRIAPFILRRTKQEVLKDLPPKIIQDYNCKPSPLQKLLLSELNQMHPLDCKPRADEGELMLQRIQWHLYLANHPKLLLTKPAKQVVSSACLEQMRTEFGVKNPEKMDIQHSGKLLSLRQLLNECGILTDSMLSQEQSSVAGDASSTIIDELIEAQPSPHRALIFCQKVSMLDIIEDDFLKLYPRLKYLRLDSKVEAEGRVDIAKRFNEDTSFRLLLLTTKVGGYGLTLTGADTVIFYDHDWNPMNDLQAMDRTHRIGQTRTVNVYRLILLDTIEEKVLNLQKFKQNLAKSLIEKGQLFG